MIPATLAIAVLAPGCDDDAPECRLYCIPAPPPGDAGVVADAAPCPECSDEMGRCPAGCEAVG